MTDPRKAAAAMAAPRPPEAAIPAGGPLIKCEVRQHNHYAGKNAGDVVEVEEREYRRCRHALISLADKAREAEQAIKPNVATPAQLMYRNFKQAARGAAKIAQDARDARRRAEFVALGFKPAG